MLRQRIVGAVYPKVLMEQGEHVGIYPCRVLRRGYTLRGSKTRHAFGALQGWSGRMPPVYVPRSDRCLDHSDAPSTAARKPLTIQKFSRGEDHPQERGAEKWQEWFWGWRPRIARS
jgi:hypothetical protein